MLRSLLQLMWDLTIHPHLGSTRSLLPSMWDPPPNPPPRRSLASLLAHRLVSTPLQGSSSSLAHHPVFDSDIICNGSSLLLSVSLKVFKTRLLGRGFHTLIKNVSFPTPTNVGSLIKGCSISIIFLRIEPSYVVLLL